MYLYYKSILSQPIPVFTFVHMHSSVLCGSIYLFGPFSCPYMHASPVSCTTSYLYLYLSTCIYQFYAALYVYSEFFVCLYAFISFMLRYLPIESFLVCVYARPYPVFSNYDLRSTLLQ